jgi:hypothetical protein
MQNITVINTGYHIIVSAPYHPLLPEKSKLLGGSYNHEEKTWEFEVRHENQVRQMCFEVFGTDGEEEMATVDVHARLDLLCQNRASDVWACGRMLAKRFFKNKPPKLGPGVTLLSGGFAESGGSAKSPHLKPLPETVVEIIEVPLELAQREAQELSGVEIITDKEGLKQALIDEAERLKNRLNEIEEQLQLLS